MDLYSGPNLQHRVPWPASLTGVTEALILIRQGKKARFISSLWPLARTAVPDRYHSTMGLFMEWRTVVCHRE